MDYKVFGEKIKKFRNEMGKNQTDFGALFGVSNQAVSYWENGEKLPDISLFPIMAKEFGVSIDYLFGMNDEPEDTRADKYIEKVMECIKKEDHIAAAEAIGEIVEKFPEYNDLKYRYALELLNSINQHIQLGQEYREKTEDKVRRSSVEEIERDCGEKLLPVEIMEDDEYREYEEKFEYHTSEKLHNEIRERAKRLLEEFLEKSENKALNDNCIAMLCALYNTDIEKEKGRRLIEDKDKMDYSSEVLTASLTRDEEDCNALMIKGLEYFFKAYYTIDMSGKADTKEKHKIIAQREKENLKLLKLLFPDEKYGRFGDYYIQAVIRLSFIDEENHDLYNKKTEEYFESLNEYDSNEKYASGYLKGIRFGELGFKNKSTARKAFVEAYNMLIECINANVRKRE